MVVSSGYNTTQHAQAQKKAKRSGQAERSGEGGMVVSSGYNTTQHAQAQKKAKRSGQAERSGEGVFGGHSRLRQSNSHARRSR
jgi:hypothetical protein